MERTGVYQNNLRNRSLLIIIQVLILSNSADVQKVLEGVTMIGLKLKFTEGFL